MASGSREEMLKVRPLWDYPELQHFCLCVLLAVQDGPPQGSLGCLSALTSLISSALHAHAHPGGHTALCARWHRGSVFWASCRAQPHPELTVAHPEHCWASTKDGLSLARLQRGVWPVQSWAQASLSLSWAACTEAAYPSVMGA